MGRTQRRVTVVNGCSSQLKPTSGDDDTALCLQLFCMDKQPLRARMFDPAIAIDELTGTHRERRRLAEQGTTFVIQRPCHVQRGGGLARVGQVAAAVAERVGTEIQVTGDFQTAMVVAYLAGVNRCLPGYDHASVAVIQIPPPQGEALQAQLPANIVQPCRGRQLHLAAGVDAPTAVVQLASDTYGTGLQHKGGRSTTLPSGPASTAPLIAPYSSSTTARQLSLRRPLTRQSGGRFQTNTAIAVDHTAGLQGQLLRPRLFNRTVTIAQRSCVHLKPTAIERATAVVQVGRGVEARFAGSADGATVGNTATGGQLRILLRLQSTAVLDAPVHGDDQLASLRSNFASVAHAEAVLVADQPYLVGIHATQRTHVQCKGWRLAIALLGGDAAVIGADDIAAQAGLQLVSPDACVDIQRAGDDVGVIGAAGIQACAADTDGAAIHAIPVQCTAVDDGRAGGQRHPAGVEEATAIHLDAGRIGDHHLRAVTCHFDIAAQLAGIGAIDLVEDYPCRAGCQVEIALHPAAQFRLYVGA